MKYDHANIYTSSYPYDEFNPAVEIKFHTDSIFYHFKILIPDQYYYQFYEKIPLSSEKGENIKRKKIERSEERV